MYTGAYKSLGFSELTYWFIPAILVAFIAHYIGSVFMEVYGIAINTILHCFILDESLNGDGNGSMGQS